MVTSLLAVCAEAEPINAKFSLPLKRAIAVAERVILPKPDRKLRRGLRSIPDIGLLPWMRRTAKRRPSKGRTSSPGDADARDRNAWDAASESASAGYWH